MSAFDKGFADGSEFVIDNPREASEQALKPGQVSPDEGRMSFLSVCSAVGSAVGEEARNGH